MSNDNDAPYVDKWFDKKTVHNGRKILKRWTEEKVPNNMKVCGTIYSHYFNWKIANVLLKTRGGGEDNFFDSYNKHGFYILKSIFRRKFLEVIKKEVLAVVKSQKLPWNAVAISKKQVKSVLFDNVRLENPEDHGGCDFLHHFLSGVAKGTFPKKKFFELTVLKTAIRRGQTWKDCIYHEDLSDAPEAFLNDEESVPITLYFAIDDKDLHLDIEPKRPKTGRPPKQHTLKLNAGDILLFDTCNTKHRTSKPTKNTTCPYRVNIVMTGLHQFLKFTAVDATSGEEELDPEPKRKRRKRS
jgi:hypothetical protein